VAVNITVALFWLTPSGLVGRYHRMGYLGQGCTSLERMIALATKFCMVATLPLPVFQHNYCSIFVVSVHTYRAESAK
jgi:hypothetical protein